MSQDPQVPGTGSATSASSTDGKVAVGNPRDIQGVMAIAFTVGWHALAVVAVVTGKLDVTVVAAGELGLLGSIIGYYFGTKAAQANQGGQ